MPTFNFNYKYFIAGAALNAKGYLYRVKPSRSGESPSWDGHGNNITTLDLKKPITDRSFWEGRYALTVVTIQAPDGTRLEMDDIVIGLNRQKTIVRTPLVGLDGTIKEFICTGDFDISMSLGVVATDASGNIIDEYPEDGVRDICKILDLNEQLKVQSPFFDMFDIGKLVVTGYSLRQMTESNRQAIDIKAVSDEDYEIRSIEY